MKQNILVVSFSFEQEPDALEILTNAGHTVDIIPQVERVNWTEQDFVHYIESKEQKPDALLMGSDFAITESFLARVPSIKYISLNCAGYDHVDLKAVGAAGVRLANVPRQNFDAVADFTWGQILCLMRKIHLGDRAIREGKWCAGVERSAAVSRKTLGVLGFGAIGKAVARRAVGFDMDILVLNRTKYPELEQEYGLRFVDKEEFFKSSDIVAVTCPYNEDTHHLINAETLGMMKSSAFVVNSSRGGIVDTMALQESLMSGRLAGAALDVFEEEPLYESPLFSMGNILLTPHMAGLADREIRHVAVKSAENLVLFLSGGMPASCLPGE